ncbi:poly(A) polymerase [Actinophytocola oryzae]|uniref:Endonuclease/exonuclease/phosphatase family protein n=1 Tax=Actinophytocola oryzae TaxID=502181 RepID=A0A4R7VRR2_9PSEU|nr:poly(A) polymerase [Actinophytocola oryzae]TDV52362.1 endonuclease/exonuclease/phosphatase family protein [Actinophytocola oryzae]
MRTSEEIYHRVRWDPRFDPARFTLGILVRGAPPKRLPLPSFVPGGDVPWHRVLFIEADGEVVWDRATGVDRLDETHAGRGSAVLPSFFTTRQVHGDASGVPGFQLRVLTWNTLWDRFDSDLIDTASRRPLLVEALARSNADVIALQEVEPALYDMVALDGYTITSGADVDEHGLVLLSRLPVLAAGHHALSAHKGVAAMVVRTAAGPVAVLATHLTSDHHPYGPARRVDELRQLAVGLADLDHPLVLVGDFNGGAVEDLGLADAWTVVHDDETPTFDPPRNPLAAVSSLTGRAFRLDRVLVRGVRPVAAALLGTEPPFVSDHYGVAATVDLAPHTEVLDEAPTTRTAVAWLPPEDLWPALNEVRAAHDPAHDRWPPHVNVLFGFVPESSFERAVPLLASAAASVPPFPVRLAEVRRFDHGTVWLDPAADPTSWTALRQALVDRFPQCAGRFTPHLTVGRDVAAVDLPPMSATVGRLVVLSRRGTEPMRPRMTVDLGTGAVRGIREAPPPPATTRASVAGVLARVGAAVPDGVVHVVGSRRMGCDRDGADLDLVAVLPGEVDLGRIQVSGAERVRRVTGARVPGLRFRLFGLSVDLTLAGEPASPVALSAITDAEAVLAAVADRHDAFATLARTVKAWAAARGLDSAPHGGLPGLAWAVLAARTVRENDDASLADFFGQWAAWDWREPVTLLGDDVPATEDAMTIMTPSAPVRSCTEQVSAGMRDLVTSELYAAWETVEDPLPATPLHRRHAAWAVLTVEGDAGRLRGRVRALLDHLPADAHAWPAPIGPGRFVIGLGANPPDADELATAVGRWGGVPGVRVELVGNGDVPTL